MNSFVNYGNAYVSPCKDCADRHEKCHQTCEKYLAFRKDVDKEREHIKQMKEKNGLVMGHMRDVRHKQKTSSWKKDRGDVY